MRVVLHVGIVVCTRARINPLSYFNYSVPFIGSFPKKIVLALVRCGYPFLHLG